MDNLNYIGHQKVIDYITEELEKRIKIKKLGSMKEYIRCTMKRDQNGFQLSQPNIIKKLQHQFREVVKDHQIYRILMASGQCLMKPKEGKEILGTKKQTEYRSEVRTLLYLMKHSQPDIANAI